MPIQAPPAAAARWRSLEFRLAVAAALLIGLAVALATTLVVRTASRHSEQLVLDQSLAQTRRLAGFLSARLVRYQLALRASGERLDLDDADGPTKLLHENAALTAEVHVLFVADPQGNVLAMWNAERGVHRPSMQLSDRAYFKQTIDQQRPIISEPMMGRASNQPVVVLTMPVRGADGQVAAVLGGAVRLAHEQWLPRLLSDDEHDPALVVITDARGQVLSHPDAAWLMRDAGHEPSLVGAAAHWMAQGRPAEPDGDVGRFGPQLVAWAGVPDAEWIVFRAVPAATALAGVEAARREAVGVGIAVALAGGLGVLMLSLALLRPLRRLERSALAAFDGADVAGLDWPRAGGEIGRLTQALRSALTQRQQAAARGRSLTAQLQAVREHAPVGFAITRAQHFELVSAHFEHLLGHPSGGLEGRPARGIYASDEDYDATEPRVVEAFAARRPFDDELQFVRRDGQRFWGRLRGQPVDWDDAVEGTIWMLEDVTRQREEREALAWASSHDALTRLANRSSFEQRLAAVIADRRSDVASALFIDLDRFKHVNDNAGHAAGDAMLQAVAEALLSQVRHNDLVARLGGDEFAVLLLGCDRHGAVRVAEKMRQAINAARVQWAGGQWSVGASIGVVEIEPAQHDVAAVMAAADQACYAAKRGGRDAVRAHGDAALRVV